MTDRELLEMAAKAAGYEFRWFTTGPGLVGIKPCWDPLTDDGDALRLAVKLRLKIDTGAFDYPHDRTEVWRTEPKFPQYAEHRDDPYAATRRAIVRAAAEIGRGK